MSQHILATGNTCNVGEIGKVAQQVADVMFVDRNISTIQYLQTHKEIFLSICNVLIVDELISKQFSLWATAGAYGDNLIDVIETCASQLNLSDAQIQDLKDLGEVFNFNGYNEQLSDLWFNSVDLYKLVRTYTTLTPFDFIKERGCVYKILTESDLEQELNIDCLLPKEIDTCDGASFCNVFPVKAGIH